MANNKFGIALQCIAFIRATIFLSWNIFEQIIFKHLDRHTNTQSGRNVVFFQEKINRISKIETKQNHLNFKNAIGIVCR